ncbi:STAS domain-containing protein [Chloroflexota bacterium]
MRVSFAGCNSIITPSKIGGTRSNSFEGGHGMEILEKKIGDVYLLSIGGNLDAYSVNDVESKLNSLIDAGHVRLVVSLDKLEYISSSGLRVLLVTLKKVRKQQGDIRLACLKSNIKEVFDISGFIQLFNISDTEETAIDSFAEV